ncbi:hypothetical protein B296_00019060, partial [Ensete ventricosum]
MHPLRFPNNGIRANVFKQKIGFKLRVMRLNRVELFYAFLLRCCSKRSEEGRPATARASAGGGRLWPGALQEWLHMTRAACKGSHPQGGNRQQVQRPMAKAVASKRGRPRAWLAPT